MTLKCRGVKRTSTRSVTADIHGRSGNSSIANKIRTLVVKATGPPALSGLGAAGYPAYGSVMIPASSWFGGHGVNVMSNGYANNLDGHWQCVELVNRFLTSENFGPAIYGDAQNLYANASSSAYEKHPNGSGYLPVAGDIIVLGGGRYGHVVVVDAVVGATVYAVEQNSSSTGRTAFTLNGSTLSRAYGLSVIGTLHAKANHAPQSSENPNAYSMAFQANTGDLFSIGSDGGKNWQQGVMPGTSPAIAATSGGGHEMAFQANTGNLFSIGSDGGKNWEQGVMPGTSPSITGLSGGGYQIAFQANTGDLISVGSAGNRDWEQGVMAGTSPSIAGLSGGGYEIAFQANTGDLYSIGSAGGKNWQQGVKAGTSPTIAGLTGGGYEMAFQANTGDLFSIGTAEGKNWQQGVMAGTSPSIAALSGGSYQIAFQANTGDLISVGGAGNRDWQQGVMPGTSPSIAGLGSGGYEIAFQANTGNLFSVGSAGGKDWQQGVKAGTSPSVSR